MKNRTDTLEQPPVTITQAVLDEIIATIGHRPPEAGGLLGGNREAQTVTRYVFDRDAKTTCAEYNVDGAVASAISTEWDKFGDKIIGFVHSHPAGYNRPSGGDEDYARRILEAIPALERLFLPIAIFKNVGRDGTCEFEILPFTASLDQKGRVVISTVELRITNPESGTVTSVNSFTVSVPDPFRYKEDETFQRVRSSYDLDLLRRSRVVVVGVGGASELVESLARTGVGQFVLIDHDVVSKTNLATQQTYRRDIGRPKVQVLADRILDINPSARVVPVRRRLEELNDREMEQLLLFPVKGCRDCPSTSLLCGFTDSFPAQVRINRLALHFAVPSLCAQMYKEGRGGEVSFTHPSITPACHRCALSSRYKAYEEGTVEPVTSDGSSIFSTVRLNAVSGYIALGLLHTGSDHARWNSLIQRAAQRNLVLVRMDPDFGLIAGMDVFERTFGDSNKRIFFDETIWSPVTADDGTDSSPVCPECGGLARLRSLRGTYSDTRTGARKSAPQCQVEWCNKTGTPQPVCAVQDKSCQPVAEPVDVAGRQPGRFAGFIRRGKPLSEIGSC